jgi:hypothetical protein
MAKQPSLPLALSARAGPVPVPCHCCGRKLKPLTWRPPQGIDRQLRKVLCIEHTQEFYLAPSPRRR